MKTPLGAMFEIDPIIHSTSSARVEMTLSIIRFVVEKDAL